MYPSFAGSAKLYQAIIAYDSLSYGFQDLHLSAFWLVLSESKDLISGFDLASFEHSSLITTFTMSAGSAGGKLVRR